MEIVRSKELEEMLDSIITNSHLVTIDGKIASEQFQQGMISGLRAAIQCIRMCENLAIEHDLLEKKVDA